MVAPAVFKITIAARTEELNSSENMVVEYRIVFSFQPFSIPSMSSPTHFEIL